MKKIITLLTAGLLLAASLSHAEDFVDTSRLYGWSGTYQFSQYWTEFKAQLNSQLDFIDSGSVVYAVMNAETFDVTGTGGSTDKFDYLVKGWTAAGNSTYPIKNDSGIWEWVPLVTGGGGSIVITEQASDPTYDELVTGDLIVATGSGSMFYKSDTGLYTYTGVYVVDPSPPLALADDFSTDTKANYTEMSGADTGVVDSGHYTTNALSIYSTWIYDTPTDTVDQYFEGVGQLTAAGKLIAMVRADVTQKDSYMVLLEDGSVTLRICSNEDFNQTNCAWTANVTGTWAINTDHTVRVEMVGDDLTVDVNGIEVLTEEIKSSNAHFGVGLGSYGGSPTWADTYWDSWEAGTL